jgi:predicted enzyme related to lactoylglutathione lyase
MKLGPIIEIIIYVKNMEAQVEFYRDTLGLSVSYPQDLENYADEYWVTFDTGVCILALHGGGTQDFGKDAPKFVFQVDDVSETRQALLAKNVPMGEIRSPAPGTFVCDGVDPEGNKFSLESRNQ